MSFTFNFDVLCGICEEVSARIDDIGKPVDP